jgi:hypothetical protein
MKLPSKITRFSAAIYLSIAGLAVTACNLFASPLVASCEAALKKQLAAPSTYRQIQVTETQSPISADDYLKANEQSETVRRFLQKMNIQPVRARAIIEYEASNRYGVPLRSFVECLYDAQSADGVSNVNEHSVKVNGKTHTDYLIDATKKLIR